jgi:EmrB/QacA subfamily drug resistance transporter
MSTLDFFIVNVAVPSVQSDLHASAGQIQWTIAGFALAVGAGVITAGRLGDLFGRRRVFSVGLALFTVTSAACGLVPDAGELVAARVAQGLSAALMTPQVLAIIGTVFTGKALGRAFTAYGLTMGLAAVFGQLIGGGLIQADLFGLGWRCCFLINVPIGVAALALTPRYVPSTRGTGQARLDLVGATLVTAALIATVLPLIDGREQGWPLWTELSFAAAAVLYAGFGLHQRWLARRDGAPLIDLRMFTDRAFSAGMLVQLIAWTGQGSFFLVLAVYLQQGLGLTALTSGVVFISIGGGYIATSIASGAVTARLGRQTVALGAALMMVALVLLIAASQHIGSTGSPWWLVPGLAVDGAGMGLIIAPLASIVLARVAPHHAGAASGVLSTVMQVGGALGIAVIGIVFYDSLGDGGATAVPHAFRSGLELLIAVAAGVLVAIQFVPDVEPASGDAR